MTWRDNIEIHTFFADDYENENTRIVQRGPYTLSLSVANVSGLTANFNSTLEVNADISTRHNITCQLFMGQKHLIINKKGRYKNSCYYNSYLTLERASPPNKVMLNFEYLHLNIYISVSWERGENEVVDKYRIVTNTTNQNITTHTTSVVLEGEYNIPMEIRVWAINCAGPSTQVTEEVIVGKSI